MMSQSAQEVLIPCKEQLQSDDCHPSKNSFFPVCFENEEASESSIDANKGAINPTVAEASSNKEQSILHQLNTQTL